MKKSLSFLFGALLVLSILGCSNGQLISAKDQRVTFALVLDDRSFNGRTVIADLIENDADKTHRGIRQGVQAFYVAPSAIWSETKYYAAELGTVTVP